MKDNALINFSNAEFGNVRAMLIDGEPWFVGKDVASALGYADHKNALKSHVDAEDKKGWRITTPSRGTQTMTVINESGMYALIFGSKLDSAKQFKRWVTHDVLPTIRKTGSYSVQDDPRWAQTRQNTKISHKPFTAAIDLMYGYLDGRGAKLPEKRIVFGKITNIVQNACGIIKGQRDSSPVASLNKCDQCQNMVANLILNIIALGNAKTLEDFEAQIILQLSNLNNLLCGQPVLLLNGAC
ncbi:MAG: hypothetical protein IKO74_02335 [Selenomonadaceae bacterium]|nr:hypothetical protein [Selenomonadaceae bacterium]